jgi:hypothetical protein
VLTRAHVEELAETIAALLAKLDEGKLSATPSMRCRLDGALVALPSLADPERAERVMRSVTDDRTV